MANLPAAVELLLTKVHDHVKIRFNLTINQRHFKSSPITA